MLDDIRRDLCEVLRGKPEVIDMSLVCLLGGGHLLLEDVPGVGKTTLARALARVFGLAMARVQCTPDLLPTDILGTQVLSPQDGSFRFVKGPVFTEVLLADEINRSSPRTQSALLEAMNEGQVTLDGSTYDLGKPFFVVATQNPIESQGTYELPEAELDRFMMRLSIGYPDAASELSMLFGQQLSSPVEDLAPRASREDLLALQGRVREVHVERAVAQYMLDLTRGTRALPELSFGASPRASLSLFRASQSHAVLHGRTFVIPDDVQAVGVHVLSHRIAETAQARYSGTDTKGIVRRLIDQLPVPT